MMKLCFYQFNLKKLFNFSCFDVLQRFYLIYEAFFFTFFLFFIITMKIFNVKTKLIEKLQNLNVNERNVEKMKLSSKIRYSR